MSGTAQGTLSKSTTRQQNPRMVLPSLFASRDESPSFYLHENRVKEIMEAARDGPIRRFEDVWISLDLNLRVTDWRRSAIRRTKHGNIPQNPHARREETLRVDGEYVVCPGRTALHMAVASGQKEIVSLICGVPNVRVDIKDEFGYTPLHLACHSPVNHSAVIDALMDSDLGRNSMNANAVSRDGVTPLHFAVRGKFKRTVEKLLGWKYYNSTIDVGVKSNEGETPLLLAVHKRREGDHSEELTWIIRRLIRYIKTNCPENINQTDNERKSAVHISIESRDYELMNLTLEEGGHKVNLDIKDSKGKSAWEVAFQ